MSLYAKIVLWFLVTALVTILGFGATSWYIGQSTGRNANNPMRRMTRMMMDEAISVYETKGQEELRQYLRRINSRTEEDHFLLDENGKDLLTGEVHADWMSKQPIGSPSFRFLMFGPPPANSILRVPSEDQRYNWIVRFSQPINQAPYYLYYLWLLGAPLVLAVLLALRVLSPISTLRDTVRRFGQGDLTARVGWRRRDEFGELGRTFDEMATRIDTLLVAERQLLQDISHELRTPLARLKFAVELGRTAQDPKPSWNRVEREVERLSRLVDELLEVTSAEGDPASRQMEHLDLNRLLRDVVEDCAIEAAKEQRSLDLSAETPVAVQGDSELLRRAFDNIVRNALRYSPQESSVKIELQQDSNSAIVRIRDFGPGVPDEALPNLFKPFFRVEQERGRDSGGVGLGLSITQRAIQWHHGQVAARNAKPGLEFEIRLPIPAPVG